MEAFNNNDTVDTFKKSYVLAKTVIDSTAAGRLKKIRYYEEHGYLFVEPVEQHGTFLPVYIAPVLEELGYSCYYRVKNSNIQLVVMGNII